MSFLVFFGGSRTSIAELKFFERVLTPVSLTYFVCRNVPSSGTLELASQNWRIITEIKANAKQTLTFIVSCPILSMAFGHWFAGL